MCSFPLASTENNPPNEKQTEDIQHSLKCSPISNGSGSIPGNRYGCPIAFLNCIIMFTRLVLLAASLVPKIARNVHRRSLCSSLSRLSYSTVRWSYIGFWSGWPCRVLSEFWIDHERSSVRFCSVNRSRHRVSIVVEPTVSVDQRESSFDLLNRWRRCEETSSFLTFVFVAILKVPNEIIQIFAGEDIRRTEREKSKEFRQIVLNRCASQ